MTVIRKIVEDPAAWLNLIGQIPAWGILALAVWFMPEWMSHIDRGYERNASQLQKVADSFSATADKILSQMEKEHQRLVENLRTKAEKNEHPN